MANYNQPITERNPVSTPHPCWQQELRSASAEAQQATGEILVLLGSLSEAISKLGMALVRVVHATERAAQETPNVSGNSDVPPSG